jgi:hypothetical protein
MNNSTAKNGWLNRRGKFYPCRFNGHNNASVRIARKLHLKGSLEYLGWVKVHSAGVWFYEADSYQGRLSVRITETQIKWLRDNGYEVRE